MIKSNRIAHLHTALLIVVFFCFGLLVRGDVDASDEYFWFGVSFGALLTMIIFAGEEIKNGSR